jgi:hypothetical protein
LERLWNTISFIVQLEVKSVQTTKDEEVILNLRVKPATQSQGWVALVQGKESGSEIRFQDLPTLMRYIQAVTDFNPIKGLR